MAQKLDTSQLDELTSMTHLGGCETMGRVQRTALPTGGIELRKTLRHRDGDHRCTLVERFSPSEHGMRWQIEILGTGEPWTTRIETRLAWKKHRGLTWWTAWGDSRGDARAGATSWRDPLVPAEFEDACFYYGSRRFTQPQAISLPLVTVLAPKIDRGVSLVLSPEDLLFDMELTVTHAGEMVFSRTRHRITPGLPVRFAMDLVVHQADWRAGLGWLVKRYPKYFDPPNPRVRQIAGCGAYSSHANDFDAERLMRMAFRINWKASFDFPYMGMFIPPVRNDQTEWMDFKKQRNSIRRMRQDIHVLTAQGFHVLNYFNVTEFGAFIKYPPPPRKAVNDADLWHDANDYTWYALGNAILTRAGEDKPIPSWQGCVAMDPGEPVYQQFLLDQARRHIEVFPESSGICIDRMDWLRYFNPKFDDGRSWVDGKPARSLVVSWHEIMGKLGPMMHANDKVIFCNPHYRRLDLTRHVDGVYDEFGQMGHSMNLCALLCVRKPVIEWTVATPEIKNDPDGYFQRHLHMGAFLTAPLPGNDHTILPTANVDQAYYDYGPLLDALRGKRWVLEPHAVEIAGATAKANLFAVPGGYVVPVTFGGDAATARVTLRHLQRQPGQGGFRVAVIHAGATDWTPLAVEDNGTIINMHVPLERGCAMVKLSSSWIDPATTYFTDRTTVRMGTTIRGAVIHYTLNGTEPTTTAARYTRPIRLTERTVVKMAVFVAGTKLSDTLVSDFVKVPLSAPAISPAGRCFDTAVNIEIAGDLSGTGESIHYTLDGTAPTIDSRRYVAPIRIEDDTTIRARRFIASGLAGKIASARFRKIPPLPPRPDVFISDLEPVVSTVGFFATAKVDRSTQNKPMRVAGKHYDKGMGVSAHSELAYTFKPAYQAFVAVVGIDDEMLNFPPASVTFQVRADDRLLEETPVLRPGQYWHLNVPLPAHAKRVRLIVTNAGDSIDGDHGDWANAGFLTR